MTLGGKGGAYDFQANLKVAKLGFFGQNGLDLVPEGHFDRFWGVNFELVSRLSSFGCRDGILSCLLITESIFHLGLPRFWLPKRSFLLVFRPKMNQTAVVKLKSCWEMNAEKTAEVSTVV